MFNSHFSSKTIKALAKKGISIDGLTYLPGEGDMPFATGETGYKLNNNGQRQIRRHMEVVAMAEAK